MKDKPGAAVERSNTKEMCKEKPAAPWTMEKGSSWAGVCKTNRNVQRGIDDYKKKTNTAGTMPTSIRM